jgi:hypothetical protein
MKSLMWKEWRENLIWALLPTLVILGPTVLFGTFELMDMGSVFYAGLIAGVFGAVLGFLQVFPDSSGDKRSLLLHRPLSRSQIFLGKATVGVGLYLLALGIPFAVAVGLAATPGHVYQPFGWPMTLPWLADLLTGLVYYFAGMLTAQREARWYGSRCLGLAAGLFCSIVVWTVPEFWHALLAMMLLGGLVAVAAWGSFSAGGAYAPQPRLAKVALTLTFLAGLSALGFVGKDFIGMVLWRRGEYQSQLSRQGRVLLVHIDNGTVESVTDAEGKVPPELKGKRLGRHELKEVQAPSAPAGLPKTQSYRNMNRSFVKYGHETMPGNEAWWYVPEQGRLLGYDRRQKRFIGSFGPDGFVRPGDQPRERFQGELAHLSVQYYAGTGPYLAFPGGVYAVDFGALELRTLFVPTAGETVLWAGEWEDEKQKPTLAFVGTDRSVHVVDEKGSRLFSAPLAYDRETYQVRRAGRLVDPLRYWVWYEPAWYLGVGTLETMPAEVVIYDKDGKEIQPRQTVPPRPGGGREIVPPTIVVEASYTQALFGLVTPVAEAAVLAGTTHYLESGVRGNHGTEVPLLLRFLFVTTQFFLPGVRWDPHAHAGMVFGFAASMMLSAVICALICFLPPRRYAFSPAQCIGWSLCGFVCGPVGLLLMLAVQEWPARIACPRCRKPRVVTRDLCEHCGAGHAAPALDGTEIFDPPAVSQPVSPNATAASVAESPVSPSPA